MNRTYVGMGVMIGVLVALSSAAEAKKQVWNIGASQVVISNGESHEYVLSWEAPQSLSGLRVDQATLEFYVDADDEASDAHFQVVVAPVTDVSGPQGSYTVVEGRSASYVGSGPGADRRVVVDVTPAVRYWVGEGGTVYWAMVGEGVTDRSAALSTGNLEGSTVAKLTVWTSKR